MHSAVSPAVRSLFAAYFAAFNARDFDRLASIWSRDCTFRTRPGHPDLFGCEQIVSFYREVWTQADERLILFGLESEEDSVLAEIGTEIRARVDMPDFGEHGLAAGDVIKLRSIVSYRLKDGKIAHIQGRKVLSRTIENTTR